MRGHSRAIVLDTETTGIDPESEATEIGWCDVFFDDHGEFKPLDKAYVQRCKPDRQIELGSMIVTHIYPEDLVSEPSHRDVIPKVVDNTCTYVIGHNIDFDVNIIKNAGVTHEPKRICTLAISRFLFPKAENHKLSMILHLLDYDYAREHSHKAHSAKHDVIFCVRILRVICKQQGIRSMEELYEFSERCRIPKYMPFGEHKGLPLSEIDGSYKEYMATKTEDPYLKQALEESVRLDIENNTNLPTIMPITKHKGELIASMAKTPAGRGTLAWIHRDDVQVSTLLKMACSKALNSTT